MKGIDHKRLKWKGYGESMLVNKCKNNIPCSEEEHQANRRTEFKVIKISNAITRLDNPS
jgi:outer membrane protein OmpA-like peptidoglycan-associated protein